MSDLISRQAAINAIISESTADGAYGYIDTKNAVDLIEKLPSARPTGKWLLVNGYRCSKCNWKCATTGLPMYCPSCGANMRGEL